MGEAARFERVTLPNGTRAIRDLHSGEVMHPSVGPWAEAQALYAAQGKLAQRLAAKDERAPGPVRVWDVGLGGAANAAAALACAQELRGRTLELVSFERDLQPLELALADPEGFSYLQPFAEAAWALLRGGASEGPFFRWRLLTGDFLEALVAAGDAPELVFFDPFSPETNTSLWTPEAFAALRRRCREDGPGTLLLTYSASTRTRVSMLSGGFFVGVGAAIGHKKETTTAATRRDLLERPLDGRWLERWRRSSARAGWGSDEAAAEAAVPAHPQFGGSSAR